MKRNPRRTAPGFRIPVPYNPLTGKYAPLGPEKDHQAIVLFEATSALVYADPLDATAPTLTARKWAYDKTTGERAVNEAETETTVYMSVADFDGEAYLGVAHIAEGDHFWAVLDSQAGRWEVVGTGSDLPTGTTTNDILRWEADQSGSSSSGEGGRWVIEPAPSDSGEWVLAVVEGVMQWREVKPFTCGDESSGA